MSLDQIKTSVQQGIASVAYVGNTTPAQIRTALSSVLSNATTFHASIRDLPTSDIALPRLLNPVIPQGIALAVSVARATSSLKTLSTPLTPDDGTVLLATSRAIRDQIVAMLNEYTIRIPAIEVVIPGVSKFVLSTLQSLTDDLAKHLIAAAPSNVPQSEYVKIQDTITAAIQKAQARLPA